MQSILYRLVALASGCALNWNAGNQLCSMLAARSLIETVASLHSFEKELRPALESEDLAKLNELTLHHSFATKEKRMLDEHIGFEATNVLTLVDKLERQFEIDGLRDGYDRLSERCHPNAAGHYFFFGMLDPETGTITYAETKNSDHNLNIVLGACLLLGLANSSLAHLDELIRTIADLQDRLRPIPEN